MLKRLLLVALVALIGLSTASAQFNKAELNFLRTEFKVQMNGDALVGVRADGKSNTYGLPSVKDFVKKFKSSSDKSTNGITATLVDIGARTIYDLCSNGSTVQVWQDPATPGNIHAVFVHSPPGDPSFAVRLSKYYFSTDKGATWTFVADVPTERSGFPTISGFSDGSALIGNHSADGGGTTRAQAYKDAAAGLGSFTRLDAPGNNAYIWPRLIATNNTTLSNKFIMIGSMNGSDTTRWNTCTNFDATPGTWLGWNTFPSDQAETYGLGRGTDGRIGIVYKNNDGVQPSDYADVWFMESTNNGTSFGAPVKIFDANFATDSLGPLRGVSIVYKGNAPAVAFETVKQTQEGSFFPGLPAKIRFWSNTLPGSDPNRSIVVADTNRVGYHPYVGVNDVLSTLCRPNIGVSSDGSALFIAFMVPSDEVGGAADTTTFGDIWLAGSLDGGLTWPDEAFGKVNPVTPIKDWRYVSVSPWNDKVGTDFYCNMVALKGHIPGSFVNGVGNGESNEEYWSIRAKVSFVSINTISTEVPSNYSLSQNYPNPFNPTTNIKFAVAKTGFVTLKVYDLSGKEVASLVNNNLSAGTYNYAFDGSKLSSGIYFYTIRANDFSETKKMMLIK
jgi:hypothetical protein